MNFPKSLDDAAKIDGLSRFEHLFAYIFPLSKAIFATLIVFLKQQKYME